MTNIDLDLWEDDELKDFVEAPNEIPSLAREKTSSAGSDNGAKDGNFVFDVPNLINPGLLRVNDGAVEFFTTIDLRKNNSLNNDLEGLHHLVESKHDSIYCYRMPASPANVYTVKYALSSIKTEISPQDAQYLKSISDKIITPTASVANEGKHIEIRVPNIKAYRDILKKVNAYPVKGGFRVNINRVLDLESLIDNCHTTLPKIHLDTEVLSITRDPIVGFDGELEGLRNVPLNALNTINSNLQQYKHIKKNKKTLAEKFAEIGIETLYDLLFTLPKKFIDKSNPQEITGLVEGESVTIIGVIDSSAPLPNNMGISFQIVDQKGKKIKCNFWRQDWLKAKFKEGDEVLLTGKTSFFKRSIELNGSSIEHAEEASILPIVPVYRQSETKGITTQTIMAAVRELLSRAGEIQLPEYLKANGKMTYTEALNELHFPSSLENFKKSCDTLAYYELIYTQILIQEENTKQEDRKFLVLDGKDRDLQNKLTKSLPFRLTGSQIKGIREINNMFADDKPSNILLNADVGAGKTLVAQYSCLKAIESGYQSVVLAPTEILAQQLFRTFKDIEKMLDTSDENFCVEFLSSGSKVKEKKEILSRVESGEIDILIGTLSVASAKVKYHNLGLIVIDEQQKFGTDQRDKLLYSRSDDFVPEIIMMSATPIPRSVAQMLYGDMTMVELAEKPAGRLPINTEWIQEDPIELTQQITNRVWADVLQEAQNGNQTFIITPLVQDSDKVDAASAENARKSLAGGALQGLSVGLVHGKMKKTEQQTVMQDFRDKIYDVLVASTVVEVGVDIPDATRVVVLSAERLGASSLHQIRGRVGRKNKQSQCYLVSIGATEHSSLRLQSMVESENGFDIALSDLDARGEGKVFGTAQTGGSDMIFASLMGHRGWIEAAQNEATEILHSSYRDIAIEEAKARFYTTEGVE